VTGIRLEVLEDPSLPLDGPGYHSTNGNFLLTELEVFANISVAVPGLGPWGLASCLALLSAAGLWLGHRK
jgi:hypothetical protein